MTTPDDTPDSLKRQYTKRGKRGRAMYDYACKYCHKPFQSYQRPGSIHEPGYCSKQCANDARRKHKPIRCKFCNELFTPHTRGMIYCSKPCFNAQRHEDAKIECPVCGIRFNPAKRGIIHCSATCYGKTMLGSNPREGKEFSKAVRRTIRKRDGNKCVKCGSTKKLHIDHIIAIGLGGTNAIENGQLLCHSCHIEKTITDRKKMRRRNMS